jgi:hypothetical protein
MREAMSLFILANPNAKCGVGERVPVSTEVKQEVKV